MSPLKATCRHEPEPRPTQHCGRNSCSSCRALAEELGSSGTTDGELAAVVVFLKSLVISQFSVARNRTLCEVRLPRCMQADGALGPSVGDTVTVITRVRLSVTPSRCAL